jgi:hypothetical protein
MKSEALLTVYLYLGGGMLILAATILIHFFRQVKIIMDTMHIFVQLMIGLYEQEKQKNDKADEGGFGT